MSFDFQSICGNVNRLFVRLQPYRRETLCISMFQSRQFWPSAPETIIQEIFRYPYDTIEGFRSNIATYEIWQKTTNNARHLKISLCHHDDWWI